MVPLKIVREVRRSCNRLNDPKYDDSMRIRYGFTRRPETMATPNVSKEEERGTKDASDRHNSPFMGYVSVDRTGLGEDSSYNHRIVNLTQNTYSIVIPSSDYYCPSLSSWVRLHGLHSTVSTSQTQHVRARLGWKSNDDEEGKYSMSMSMSLIFNPSFPLYKDRDRSPVLYCPFDWLSHSGARSNDLEGIANYSSSADSQG